ncbi:type IV pilus modification protein PilV [Suttonella sp. R2A3]|uniref:type IV pilus modification protein PilV n=1 Tax=Suttonella sp. R2A3 TaxID=2908648 RepID=UPI001F33F115|nr:type IV pilus modification protein PilV [Suttonella sp. R2A3]UJF25240.1 type IV pilus modification protein PilV [Suttonella sp. R2A3]
MNHHNVSLKAGSTSHTRREWGMTILEVLVALLVVGLGMTMAISMLQSSVRYNQTAEYRSIALGEIEQITDRMRTNRMAANNDDYLYPASASERSNPDPENTAWTPPSAASACSASCTIEQLAKAAAERDLHDWGADVAASLPEGAGYIDKVGDQYRVSVFWRHIAESDKGSAGEAFRSVSMLVTL